MTPKFVSFAEVHKQVLGAVLILVSILFILFL